MIGKLSYIFGRKEKTGLFLLLLMIFTGSMLELAAVAIFQPFIAVMINPESIADSRQMRRIYDFFALASHEQFLSVLCIAIVVIYVFKNAFLWFQQRYVIHFTLEMQRRMSVRLLAGYMKEPYTFHLNTNVAVLLRNINGDTGQFTKMLTHSVQLLMEIVVCIMLGIALFVVSQSMAVVIGVSLLICIGLYTQVTRRYVRRLAEEARLANAKKYQWLTQSLYGIKEILVLNRASFFVTAFEKYSRLFTRASKRTSLIVASPKYLVETVCIVGMIGAIIIKLNFGRDDTQYFVSQLAVFAVAAFRLLPSANRINEHISSIISTLPSLDMIFNDLKGIEAIENQRVATQESREWRFEQGLRIRHVSYTYPNTEEKVLDDAECEIPKGKTVAFIGSSGAGKTTMADIILGLLEPQLGRIMADDMNVMKNIDVWRRQVGYIPQAIYLCDDTIRNNVAFGVDETLIDDRAVEEALRRAQLADFVESLPEGLDTFVGDRGVRLSGGQRQRVGIARALYHDPEILILDEATSALDNETESAVMDAINSLHGMKTMLIIAHRLTTIKNADIIYEITDGKIIPRDKDEVFR